MWPLEVFHSDKNIVVFHIQRSCANWFRWSFGCLCLIWLTAVLFASVCLLCLLECTRPLYLFIFRPFFGHCHFKVDTLLITSPTFETDRMPFALFLIFLVKRSIQISILLWVFLCFPLMNRFIIQIIGKYMKEGLVTKSFLHIYWGVRFKYTRVTHIVKLFNSYSIE